MGRIWRGKSWIGLCWLPLVAAVIHPGDSMAESIGATLSARYNIDSNETSGYWVERDKTEKYKVNGTLFITEGNWRAAINPYMNSNGRPAVAGVYAGIGYDFGEATLGMYHHSCHNLDYGEPNVPDCRIDGVMLRWSHGRTFQPLW